jgi:hypothetical protein
LIKGKSLAGSALLTACLALTPTFLSSAIRLIAGATTLASGLIVLRITTMSLPTLLATFLLRAAHNLIEIRERSHSHRGFSPVGKAYSKSRKPFERFFPAGQQIAANRKPLKTVQDFGMLLYHRAKATV